MHCYYNASKMDLQQQKDNITLNVILAYLTVLSNQETLDIAQKAGPRWIPRRWPVWKFRIRKAPFHQPHYTT